ncbi:MAG: hypothetical protein R2749_13705 [Acidimicrobiales bacterium]
MASLAIRLLLPNFLDPAAFGRLVFAESLALLLFASSPSASTPTPGGSWPANPISTAA